MGAVFPQFRRPPQNLVAGGLLGAASAAQWAGAPATPLDWEGLFASTGLFGVELGAEAGSLAGSPVELRGFMSPPMTTDSAYFVLSRSPLPNCPFCSSSASWPDDIVVAHLQAPGVDLDDPMREIAVRGLLELGELAGPAPGLASHVRLRDALWIPADRA